MDKAKTNRISFMDGEVFLNLQCPKRILHFSDGILEEYSDENESEEKIKSENQESKITENELQWVPWILYKTKKTGKTILAGCDYIGESLATFLGITTPKYSSEIEEFYRVAEENRKFLEKEKSGNATWQERKQLNSNNIITKEIVNQEECNRF